MKFTEEQYQKIVSISKLPQRETEIEETINYVQDIGFNTEFDEDIIDMALAISNPLTREWAHDKFVVKEKKYYWTGNKEDNVGFVKRLYKDDDGMIIDHGIRKGDTDKAEDEQLTESEIKAWGYNPDVFDREEV
ncbi:hypothetical protein [Leuconostoc falkenbergense]|uniref:hypothetical protein n=1 Tax=Leuconostoc falkenbergense TaxID=2766470 RepID=UPI0024A84C41|nr:hypothetical protein [Leuconostoc falkenbergense]MDI6553130.1 hypothetical protein [Leuconostoc falkenbergense]